MPLFTFYFKHRNNRVPVGGLGSWPSDWLEVRNGLLEAMQQIHQKYGLTNAIVSLERHLKGKGFLGTVDYRQTKISFKRGREAVFNVEYYPRIERLTIKNVWFGYSLSFLRPEFLMVEKGKLPTVPALIPREHKNVLLNPKRILAEMSGRRYGEDYGRPKGNSYSFEESPFQPHKSYERLSTGSYGRQG